MGKRRSISNWLVPFNGSSMLYPQGRLPTKHRRNFKQPQISWFPCRRIPSSNEKTWSLKPKHFAQYRVWPFKTMNRKHTASRVIWLERSKAMSHLIVRYRPHGSQVCHFLRLLFHCQLCPLKSIAHTHRLKHIPSAPLACIPSLFRHNLMVVGPVSHWY